nr:hypothetical protein [Frankia sp. ArI3]
MVSRSAYAQLRHSPLLLLGTVLGMSLVFVVPVVATVAGLAAGDSTTAIIGAVAWVIMTLSYVPMIRYYRQPVPAALLLPGVAVLYLGMTLDSARLKRAGRGAAWKGRTYDDHGTPSADRLSSDAATPATAPSVPAPSVAAQSTAVPTATVAPAAAPPATAAPAEASLAAAGPVAAVASPGPGATIPAAAGPVEPPRDPWNDGFSRSSPRPGRTDEPRREDAARAVPAPGGAQSQARADDRPPGAGR